MNHSAKLVPFPPDDGWLGNLEAEAALLGALIIDNDALASIEEPLSGEHFAQPVHGRIFNEIKRQVSAGSKANAITLRPFFEGDEGLIELGGPAYLVRLSGDMQGLLAVREIAAQIVGLAQRRQFIEGLEAAKHAALDLTTPIGSIDLPAVPLQSTQQIATLDLVELAEQAPAHKSFIIPRIAPAGEATLLTGGGGVGKSTWAQQIATACAAGVSTLGLEVRQVASIYLTCEDDADQLHWRQVHICRSLNVTMADLAGRLYIASRRGVSDNTLALIDGAGRLRPSPFFGNLRALIRSAGARLVFLDNVAHLFPGDENDRGQVTEFVNLLNRLASNTGAAIVLLCHPNKGGDTYSGSTAWLNAVRSQVTMERPKGAEHDPDLRSISIGKANYTRSGEALRCRWMDWAFIRDEDLSQDLREQLDDTIAASSENAAFLDCLRARASQGEAREVGPKPGPSYAPSQFEAMPQARGHDRQALKRAMERLSSIGRIEFVEVRNAAKGRNLTVIREVKLGASGASPNASPNPSRTLFPNTPDAHPNTPRSIPEHSPPPTGEVGGAPSGGARTSLSGEEGQS